MTKTTKLPRRLNAALLLTCLPDTTFVGTHHPRNPNASVWSDDAEERVVLKSAERDVEFIIRLYDSTKRPSEYDRKRPEFWMIASGTTNFGAMRDGKRIGLTFDRTGVEESFYIHRTDTVETVTAIFNEHLTRVAASRARSARSVVVPQIGFSVTPESKVTIIATLKAGRSYAFRPAGFGTGYCLSLASRRRGTRLGYGTEMASKDLNEFFGVGALLVERMDCD